jgi:hypothetical protein
LALVTLVVRPHFDSVPEIADMAFRIRLKRLDDGVEGGAH